MTKIGKAGLDLIKSFEGVRLAAYKPVASETYWTIGYGHYGADVKKGSSISMAKAESLLKDDLARFEKAVDSNVKVSINQNQFDALVSFTFNCGTGALQTSTLLQKVNSKDFTAASKEFGRWVKDGNGNALAGLVRRREAERALFVKSVIADEKPSTIVSDSYYTTNPKRIKLLKSSSLRKINAQDGGNWDKHANIITPTFKAGTEFVITGIKYSSGGTPRLITQSGHLVTANKTYVKQVSTTASVPAKQYHTVKFGDSVSYIAKKYKTTESTIKNLNNLANVNKIYVGQKLRVK